MKELINVQFQVGDEVDFSINLGKRRKKDYSGTVTYVGSRYIAVDVAKYTTSITYQEIYVGRVTLLNVVRDGQVLSLDGEKQSGDKSIE